MVQRLVFAMMFCAFGLISLLVAVQPSVARTLIVAVNNAPPYRVISVYTNSASYSGIYIDVIRDAAKRIGLDLSFEVVPFKRALYLLERGEADLMLGPNRTDERQKYMYYFGAALPDEPKAVYINEIGAEIRDIKDLDERSVGVLRGANYNRQFDEAKGIRLVEAADYSTLFRMLDMQHINALIVPELQAVEQIKREGPYHIRKAELVLQGQPSFIAISRRSDYFTDGSFTELERVLVEMRQDGTFGRIYSRYATPAQ
ncbi:hypothetical protein TH19_02855 [Thalassospira profundimaris]|uniref:Solute-binding protein family 3/N-terminal domain-containing protein n=1 Tax=Thalassospira profundimaris TaxID=502049 RepID=A0A367WE52_9PROT|nr:hypothetical protein TH19_02855 [Thalassospira profundimaris]